METLADSNITKRALAAALKELMREMPVSKISVGNICERCEMNRKSFYYHFRDKYDLVNWIYDTEFITVMQRKTIGSVWEFLEELCRYFYENRDFYRKALQIRGQNSFEEHFREMLLPVEAEYLRGVFPEKELEQFHINFYADALLCALERWLLDEKSMPPEEFVRMLRSCIYDPGREAAETEK